MRIAVIPARGGSKRIARKNVKHFHGKPMLAWSIETALASNCFDRVIVSTDDEEIAAIAKTAGADVPFLRPAELADDFTPTVPVVAHAVDWFARHQGPVDSACCVYAAAPFIRSQDLVSAYDLMIQTGACYAFPVTSFAFPVQRGVRILENGKMEMFYPEHALTRSQDLEEAFHDAGQFYWGLSEAWLSGKTIIGPDAAALPIPRERVQDIDTPEDWDRAEKLFSLLQQQPIRPR